MPDYIAELGPFSFGGIQVPATGYRVRGGQREVTHLYPHVNRGKVEKQGLELYSVDADLLFDTDSLLAPRYPDLHPGKLNALVAKFERGETADLYLPTRGTLRAFAKGWTVEMTATVTSGERMSVTFLEDDEDGFEVGSIAVTNAGDVKAVGLTVAELRAQYEAEMSESDKSIFDQIDDAANAVRVALDSGDLAASVIKAKADHLVGLCSEAEDRITILQDPRTYPLTEAMHELWALGAQVQRDVLGRRSITQTYTVPTKMALPQVSLAIFGDSTRGGDLLELNFFRDAFAIQAGSVVSFYPDA